MDQLQLYLTKTYTIAVAMGRNAFGKPEVHYYEIQAMDVDEALRQVRLSFPTHLLSVARESL